jgi:hypothetical protein
MMDPVYDLDTTDMFFLPIHGRSREVKLSMLLLGRPLWYYMLATRRCETYTDLLCYALSRLRGEQTDCRSLETRLSLFMCRFGGLYPTNFDHASNFVRYNMATYAHIEVEREPGYDGSRVLKCTTGYPSEPILAAASAFATSRFCNDPHKKQDGCKKADVLKEVKEQISRSGAIVKLSKGDLGETLACALVGYQLDYIREHAVEKESNAVEFGDSVAEPTGSQNYAEIMTRPVPVGTFLIALIDEAALLDELDLLEGYFVNVTHFVRLPYKTKYSTSNHVIDRGAAVITYENSQALDFFVEAFKPLNVEATATLPLDIAGLSHPASSSASVSAAVMDEAHDADLPHPPSSSASVPAAAMDGPPTIVEASDSILGNWNALKTSLTKASKENGDPDYQSSYISRNVVREVGTYQGHKVYETKRKSFVYFPGPSPFEKRYLRKDSGCVELYDTPIDVHTVLPTKESKTVEDARVGYENIHIRFSIKNCKNSITRKEADDFLDAMVTSCEPVGAVKDEHGEPLFVSVLINVGQGCVEPFATVNSVGRVLCSRKSVERVHIKICLGLNHSVSPESDRETPKCFQHFEQDVLELFKEIAASQNSSKETALRLLLGHQLNEDRLRCLEAKIEGEP